MNFIGFGGIRDSDFVDPMWEEHLGSALLAQFPGAALHVERHKNSQSYDFWQIWKMWKYRDEVVAKYDTGEDVFLVGHSMGAMIALAAASRFKRSRVRGLISITGPHSFLFGIFARVNGCVPIEAPVLSVSGRYDEVIGWGTEYSKAVQHIVLPIDHYRDLVKNFLGVAEEIAAAAKHMFEQVRR